MALGGMGFKLGISADLDITFDSMEELEEHPIIGRFAKHTLTNFLNDFGPFERTYLEEPVTVK